MSGVWRECWDVLKRALRLVCFRRVPFDPAPVSLTAAFVCWGASMIGLWVVEAIDGGSPLRLDPWGSFSIVGGLFVMCALLRVVGIGTGSFPFARVLADLSMILLILLVATGICLLAYGTPAEDALGSISLFCAILLACFVGLIRCGRRAWPVTVDWRGSRILAVAVLSLMLVPQWPTIKGPRTNEFRLDIWQLKASVDQMTKPVANRKPQQKTS